MSTTTKMLINPPADVQTAVAAAIAACRKWERTDVPVPALPLPPVAQAMQPGPTEAQVCGFIQNPNEQFGAAVGVFLMLFVVFVVFAWGVRLHRLPGAIWRLVLRLGRRASA